MATAPEDDATGSPAQSSNASAKRESFVFIFLTWISN
jgi:hypothetical protein